MRYLLILLGFCGLVGCFISIFEKGVRLDEALSLGLLPAFAVFLAVGVAAEDIIRAIERTSQRRPDQPPQPKTPQE